MVDPDSNREVDTSRRVVRANLITIRSDGGTGRHAGLKILFALKRVRVRFPLRVRKALKFFEGFFVSMASIYILYSGKLDKLYTGSCMDLSYRIVFKI